MRGYADYLEACYWNPGLHNGHRLLGDVLSTLPGVKQQDIHWLVRLFENPRSPLRFPGQISLARHDAVHVLLGRGLSNQDEAFVIGFTMGAAKACRRWHCGLFNWVARWLYPASYRFSVDDSRVFALGVGAGFKQPVEDIHLVGLEDMMGESVDSIRRRLGINVHDLHAIYRHERAYIPHTSESKRLDIDYGNIDPSDIVIPNGKSIKRKRRRF